MGVCPQEAANLPPSAPGTFQAASWFEAVELQPATPDGASNGSVGASKRRRLAGQPKQGSAQAGAAQDLLLQRWLGQAGHVVQRFDQQLSKALVAALDACGSLAQPVAGGTVPDVRRPSGPTEAAASRALVLEPFVQDRCAMGRTQYLGLQFACIACLQFAAIAGPVALKSQHFVAAQVCRGGGRHRCVSGRPPAGAAPPRGSGMRGCTLLAHRHPSPPAGPRGAGVG